MGRFPELTPVRSQTIELWLSTLEAGDTDASAYGVGAILLQEGEIPLNVKTSKPLLHPIAYYSATFIQAERNYNIYKRELLAVVKALKHW